MILIIKISEVICTFAALFNFCGDSVDSGSFQCIFVISEPINYL